MATDMKANFAEVEAYIAGADPVSVFMDSVLVRVPECYIGDEPGFDMLTEDERVLYTTLMFDGQVYGCGFDFYFENINHNHHPYVVKGLCRIHAGALVELFHQAKARFLETRDRREIDHWETTYLDRFDSEYIFNAESVAADLEMHGRETGLIKGLANSAGDPIDCVS